MRVFKVEPRSVDHLALVRVSDEGDYVFAVVRRDDHTTDVGLGGTDHELRSIDDLVAASWELIDWERSIEDLRAIRYEGHRRRFDADQRRVLDRVAI
jgi:predicted SnoaL-like aldol condensation-catalyzing enzyme